MELTAQDQQYRDNAVQGIYDALLQNQLDINGRKAGYFNPGLGIEAFIEVMVGLVYQQPELRGRYERRKLAEDVKKRMLRQFQVLDRATAGDDDIADAFNAVSQIRAH